MAQNVFNILVSIYIVVASVAFGGIYKRIDILHKTNKTQIDFNEEVIKGFNITREALNK
jgi:hypothetical protein